MFHVSMMPRRFLPMALALSVSASLCPPDARACGPDFPLALLANRQQTLRTLPDAPFAEDAAHLLDGLPGHPAERYVVVDAEPEGVRERGTDAERALYARGAAAFHAGDVVGARASFKALMQLPETERRHRSTWATFMLGRLGDVDAWGRVRGLVDAGFHDELGLAAASLGEEALAHLRAGDDAGAVVRYARQARLQNGDDTSLVVVARALVDDAGPRRRRALRDPVVQRLLGTWAMNRSDERPAKVGAVIDELAALKDVAWPDRVAAAAYRTERFDIAKAVADRDPSLPLSMWVTAKLLLREGQVAPAAALLASASRAFPAVDRSADDDGFWSGPPPSMRDRVLGDAAILALNRGDYTFALEQLLQAGRFWQDAAQVAERVLTIEELQAFVASRPALASNEVDPDDVNTVENILARRLMRVGRLAEARDHVQDPAIARGIDAFIAIRQRHPHPGAADGAVAADIDVDVAEQLAALAVVMRQSGMELQGTELAPDFAIWGGNFETPWAVGDDGTADEAQRVAQSTPVPNVRFHYRLVAASLLEHAADHVPPRSQAYAALLCQATRYARREPAEVQRLWQRYVDHGAVVDFAGAFGSEDTSCPPPDFDGARTFEARHQPRAPRRGPAPMLIVMALVGMGVIVVAVAAVARRAKGRAPS